MDKQQLLENIKANRHSATRGVNSMGCSENWYDESYAIGNTFTDEELEQMTLLEIEHLYKLASNMSEAFY